MIKKLLVLNISINLVLKSRRLFCYIDFKYDYLQVYQYLIIMSNRVSEHFSDNLCPVINLKQRRNTNGAGNNKFQAFLLFCIDIQPTNKIGYAIPINSATFERSFSSTRMISSHNRSNILHVRFSDLSTINIKRDLLLNIIDNKKILVIFADKERRMQL